MNERITVVIPTMNRPEALRETLDSYAVGKTIPNQIVIVDQTENEVLRWKIQQLIACYSMTIDYKYQKNPSITRARNVGMELAENDIVIMSDDDVTVQADTIENVKRIMENQDIAMIAGINSRDKISKSIISCFFGKKSYFRRKIGHVTKAVVGRFPDRVVVGNVETQWAMGFFFVIRQSLVKKWNLSWDEKLTGYAYAEDLDFSYSYYKCAIREMKKCILSDKVVVDHRASVEWRVPSRKSTFMFVINREYLSYKHNMGWRSRILIRWLNFGEILFRFSKKVPSRDLFDAINVSRTHRKELKKGYLSSSWYDEYGKK